MTIRFVKKLFTRLKQGRTIAEQPTTKKAQLFPKEKHSILSTDISKNALQVLEKLHRAGHQGYLVGGGVRDLLLNLHPKDFDIATDAHPDLVRRLFRNSRIIGKRFRLVHVFFGRENIEVATFRAHHPESSHPEGHTSHSGMLIRDNIYGLMEEDAWRRDFTVNALYYNPANSTVIDYTNGMADLKKRVIRMLGDPVSRYKEDPVRMLRAIRLAAKLNFTIDAQTAKPLYELHDQLQHVAPARLFEEVVKIFYCGHASRAFTLLQDYQLFAVLFPQTQEILAQETPKKSATTHLILQSCNNTDSRVAQGKSLNPAFLFSVLLWAPLQHKAQLLQNEGHRPHLALQTAAHKVTKQQTQTVAIPKRFTVVIEEIWLVQHALIERSKRRIFILYNHPRFRAAYDFLILRLESGEAHLKTTVSWWQEFQALSATEQKERVALLKAPKGRKRK